MIETDRHSPQHDALKSTVAAQADAADPTASAWVNANAGAGKTFVLTNRVLRLLLSGTPPERILCLTYTKAAAAEMSTRVFAQLAGWVTADKDDLIASLTELIGRPPLAPEVALARTLFTRAIETPGGLKVQTIHAFCERLLQRFPLEAGVPPGFKILDDPKGREIKARAIDATLREATEHPHTAIGKALTTVIRYAADKMFDDLLSKAIEQRSWLDAASRLKPGKKSDDYSGAEAYLRAVLGIEPTASIETLMTARANVLADETLHALRDLLLSGGATDIKHAATINDVLAAPSLRARGDYLADYLLTADHSAPRDKVMSVALSRREPGLDAQAKSAQSALLDIEQSLKCLAMLDASAALYRLAGAVLHRYTDAKKASGALDFEDLIVSTTNLLATSDTTDWVLYKLDGGLDHILVDEAQDTSPSQWMIIAALAREFYSGSGARDCARTVFAVGDEKQSIYSFQGAAPEMFAEMGAAFARLAEAAAAPMRRVPLNLSFRTVAPVLQAVDRVFANSSRTPGLTTSSDPIAHVAHRIGQAGLVEIWPVISPDDVTPINAWDPLADTTPRAPANRLAEQIAETIGTWLETREHLPSQDRPIRAGDIMILVRKRHPFAVPMVAALKARGIPVAGADRVNLTDQIVVQDLLVLGDFLTLPEDDLALATILKGPIFGLDDDQLLVLAHARKGTLWKSLLNAAETDAAFKPAAETLKRWRAKADFLPPFEFFSSVLDRDGARTAMLHRLGQEAADAIDEFLDLALAYDDGAPPSLTGFLADLRKHNREIKRDMDLQRDEVRIMTVHGAKGLEAPIVFLPDTCTTSTGDSQATRLLTISVGADAGAAAGLPDPIVWPVKGTSSLPIIQRAKAEKAESDARERNRLLYVAMTRARDRLYVAGFEGTRTRPENCWYDLIADALTPAMDKFERPDGTAGWRIASPQVEKPKSSETKSSSAMTAAPLPAFATTRAPVERTLSVPLAPSRLEPYAPDGDGEPIHQPTADPAIVPEQASPLAAADGIRFLRGTLTHALLEHLPSLPEAKRKAAATAFVERRGSALSSRVRTGIVKEALAVLADPTFAPLFSATSRAEVAISAELPRPSGTGPALRLTGQIDRLAITDTDVLIVDYKTNRPPPMDVAQVADAYLFQLAAYVLALREIYPDKAVRSALLWTDGPRLMAIPETVIENAIKRLWDIDLASLDGG